MVSSMRSFVFRRGELLSILVAFLMLLCIGFFSLTDWSNYHENLKEVLGARRILESATTLLLDITTAETAQRGFLLTGDAGYLEPYQHASQDLRHQLDVLQQATTNDSTERSVRLLGHAVCAKLDEMQQTLDLRDRGDLRGSIALVKAGHGRTLMDTIRALADQVRSEKARVLGNGSLRVRSRSDRAHLSAVLSSAVLLVILGFGARNINRATERREAMILALKTTSEALRTSEGTARSLFEHASQGILSTDRDGRIVGANAMVEEMFGYSPAELSGSSVEMLLPTSLGLRHAAHRAEYLQKPHARPMGQDLDLVARRKDGSEFPVEISLSYVAEYEGGLIIAFISDITARKKASHDRERAIANLKSALAEKTVLLKEVHHRVKNNMAVIAGLLSAQANSVEDQKARASLEESQRRVLSMALIHEHLYATENLDRVNFGQYVRQLAQELRGAYSIESELIRLNVHAEEIDLCVHRGIPCGLILNELLSNAFKYSFPRGRSGEMEVRFCRLPDGDLLLSCINDGINIPENVDAQSSKSLGLRIVKILTKQLDGELTVYRAHGKTGFEVRFPGSQARPQLLASTG